MQKRASVKEEDEELFDFISQYYFIEIADRYMNIIRHG